MKYLELKKRVSADIFTFNEIILLFPEESKEGIKTQLSRFVRRGLIKRIKKGWYLSDDAVVDEYILANRLYRPSYISAETALNYYGMQPDISQAVTSVTPTTTKGIRTDYGTFLYRKIDRRLFFGYCLVQIKNEYIRIATKEKAILDYLYVHRITNMEGLRLDTKKINRSVYRAYITYFPQWMKKIPL